MLISDIKLCQSSDIKIWSTLSQSGVRAPLYPHLFLSLLSIEIMKQTKCQECFYNDYMQYRMKIMFIYVHLFCFFLFTLVFRSLTQILPNFTYENRF